MSGIARHEEERVPSVPRGPSSKRRAVSSKYDVYKVKVWLGDSHYYILSRFLISRSLTLTKIPSTKAVKIALELKKHLVDHDKLSISQAELESILFGLMRSKGYGQAHIDCYRTVSAFYQLRQPLVVIIAGAPCTGKSTIAQQLAARLNMPNVMQTDVICGLLRGPSGPLAPLPPWSCPAPPPAAPRGQLGGSAAAAAAAQGTGDDPGRQPPGQAQGEGEGQGPLSEGAAGLEQGQGPGWLLDVFRAECRVVRRALEGDFNKALADGKPLIVEGSHLDPGSLLGELQERGIVLLPLEQPPPTPASNQHSPSHGATAGRGSGTQGGGGGAASGGSLAGYVLPCTPCDSVPSTPTAERSLSREGEEAVHATAPVPLGWAGGRGVVESPGGGRLEAHGSVVSAGGAAGGPESGEPLPRTASAGPSESGGAVDGGRWHQHQPAGLRQEQQHRAYQKHVSWERSLAAGAAAAGGAPGLAAGAGAVAGAARAAVQAGAALGHRGDMGARQEAVGLASARDGGGAPLAPLAEQWNPPGVLEHGQAAQGAALQGVESVDSAGGAEGREEGGGADALASSFGGGSPLASCVLDDGASDVNYGDADTDGEAYGNDGGGGASGDDDASPQPLRRGRPPPPPPSLPPPGPAGGGGGAGLLRRIQSQPLMPQRPAGGGGARLRGDLLASPTPEEEDGAAAATGAQGGDPGGGPGARAPPPPGRIQSAAGGPGPGTPGAAGGHGLPRGTMDRAHSHQGLAGAAAAAGTGAGAGARTPGAFPRSVSLAAGSGSFTAADLAVIKNSLAGILRLGSSTRGAAPGGAPRSSPPPRLAGGRPQWHGRTHGGDTGGAWTPGPRPAGLSARDGGRSHSAAPSPQRRPALDDAGGGKAGACGGAAEARAEEDSEQAAEAAAAAMAGVSGGGVGGAAGGAAAEAGASGGAVAAGLGAGAGGGGVLPPLFVPVVLRMSEADHLLALEDNLAPQAAPAGGHGHGQLGTAHANGAAASKAAAAHGDGGGAPGAGGPAAATAAAAAAAPPPCLGEVAGRARALQDYLCGFEAQGLPVITVRYGSYGEALDVLHEYVLMCIQAAMEQLCGSGACECGFPPWGGVPA